MDKKIITLTSDFGTRDGYIAEIKGYILSHLENPTIVDITHGISPFNIGQAAFNIYNAHAWFPRGTVHIVIVDPGVGSERDIVIIEAKDMFFVGPDNGVFDPLIYLYDSYKSWRVDTGQYDKVSATFHGRDIFTPVALRLCKGEKPESMGTKTNLKYRLLTEEMLSGSEAVVLHVDHFGNIITAVNRNLIGDRFTGLKFNQIVIPFVQYYDQGEEGKPVCLFGSNGLLEVAINRGSAADYFYTRLKKYPSRFLIV
jgi:S-adenosylmethionine hydrolase